jgi:GNAT superfamily N-acetyltransferase
VVRWTSERLWDAVDAGRWFPPSATKVSTEDYELAVTPGSYALTYVYGFHVDDAEHVDARLEGVRQQIEALGGTGARFQLTPRSRPRDLAQRLERHGYRLAEEAEALVWSLRDPAGVTRLPDFPAPAGISVREVDADAEFATFMDLGTAIFGGPPPSAESRRGFVTEFHRKLREDGHSDRFLAWGGPTPIGRAGLEVAGPVARFWGTGVLPEHRRRGVYGALVRARCEAAARRGAEIALVTARVGTSGPILKHHGFRRVGPLRTYEARWRPGPSREPEGRDLDGVLSR